MAGLTVTEKEHWKERIAARMQKRVEAIKAQHPALFERVKREAHAQALESLGLAESYRELESIRNEETTLARRKRRAQRAMLAVVRGVPRDEVTDSFNVRYSDELALPLEAYDALVKRREAHQEQLLRDDPVGRDIARLEMEKESLLDTVWLAVSPAQIKQLWSKVGELLGDETTQLEREALAIDPVKEG
jgi:hypothetical protein